MSLSAHGNTTSAVEVTNISAHGIWLLAHDQELFIPYDEFPWFKDQPVKVIMNVEEQAPGHFYWPDIDVDLTKEIIEHPERFPNKARAHNQPINRRQAARLMGSVRNRVGYQSMKARWRSIDGEYSDCDADVTSCVLANGKINILFSSIEEGIPAQGRLSLDPVSSEQVAEGVWIYPDPIKANASFADRPAASEEETIKATVRGKLQNYRGKKVIFHGIWKDLDGGEYDFELEAEHS